MQNYKNYLSFRCIFPFGFFLKYLTEVETKTQVISAPEITPRCLHLQENFLFLPAQRRAGGGGSAASGPWAPISAHEKAWVQHLRTGVPLLWPICCRWTRHTAFVAFISLRVGDWGTEREL